MEPTLPLSNPDSISTMAACCQEGELPKESQGNSTKNLQNINTDTHSLSLSPALNGISYMLKGLFFGSSLFSMAIICNLIQVSTLLVYPYNRRWVSAINAGFCEAIWMVIDFAIEKVNRATFTYSGHHMEIPVNKQPILSSFNPSLPKTESALVICNHLCTVDWALINGLALRYNMLAHCKYFLKKSLEWVPLFGLGMKLAGFPFLSRNWAEDQHAIESVFRTLREDQLPCWLISFLEGTRLTPDKLEDSKNFCKSKGYPVLENVLYPRKKGFIATARALQNSHVSYIYDLTIAYYHVPTGTMNVYFPSILDLHCTNLRNVWQFHVHVDRIPLSSVHPDNEEDMEQWIEDRWKAKDELLAQWKSEWPKIGVNGTSSNAYFTAWGS